MSKLADLLAISPNFKRRLSGVTTTVINLTPKINQLGFTIKALGPSLPRDVPRMKYRDLLKLWTPPKTTQYRVWHARRNTEMLLGIILKSGLRMPLKLVFTSASQKHLGRYKRWLLRHMDAVVATSQKTADFLSVPYRVIHHGVDTTRFQPSHDKNVLKAKLGLDPASRYIGCFGRIRHLKGTDLFIQACIQALQNNPSWQAIIIGRTTAQNQIFAETLSSQIRDANLQDQIHFIEESKAIEEFYAALDLYVAPQRYEGFGLTPLEAMSCGVPVVATDVGAYKELIPKSCGVISETSANDLAKHMISIMTDDNLRIQQGKAARTHAIESLDIRHEAQGLIDLYNHLLHLK